HPLEAVELFDGHLHPALEVAAVRPRDRAMRAMRAARPLGPVGIGVMVEVGRLEGPEIDGIRTVGPDAVVDVRVEDLLRQGGPASRRATVERPRPGSADGAEAPLDVGNEL